MRCVCPECGDPGEQGACAADGASRVPVGSDALLGTTIGSWRVARAIGAGGMGRVYKAVQPAIGARVAIKVLQRECANDPELVERFFNEARAVNLIRHDNIVDVIDLGRLPDGSPYIVMEFLEGASLAALLARGRQGRDAAAPVPLGTLARLVGEVLAALEATHAKGIIHRDLKPDNVFVSPSGRVTVLDFGIAKLAGQHGTNPTQTGSLLGTPAYMAPEQARSQPLDLRADLYAVGVILYEAATGSVPFTAASLYDLLDQHVKAAPARPRARNPEIPDALEAVILRALAKDPADRFASAGDMRRALDGALEGMPSEPFAFPSIGGSTAPGPPSDPFAATAAATEVSLARGETRPSAPVGDAATRRGRTWRVAALLAVAGAVAVAVGLRAVVRRGASRSPVIADAAVVVAPPPTPPPTPHDGTLPINGVDLRSFDPLAYLPIATQRATEATGAVVLTGVNWRGFDRHGIIDLTQPHASAEYVFVATDRVAAHDPYCSVMVIFEAGAGSIAIGRMESGVCSGSRITVRCTVPELWKRAEAQGLPTAASSGSANYFQDGWYFSSPQAPDFSGRIVDDCR